jgi:predicted DNA-binding transcriptional regulator YafY
VCRSSREGVGGGYSLPDDYSLAPLALTSRETFLLLLALSSITPLTDAPFAQERVSLQAKLRALLPPQQLPQVESLLSNVNVYVPKREQRALYLEPLIAAAQKQAWVQVTYQSTERRSTQHLLPRQIYVQNGYWYCYAYSAERGEERLYRVDRIHTLSPPAPQFQPPPIPPALPFDHVSHPEIVATLTARGTAILEHDPNMGPQLQRNPDGTSRCAFHCPASEFEFFARYFAGFGADVTVCAPTELRELIRHIGKNLLDQYAQ